jgi:hypothetical protein
MDTMNLNKNPDQWTYSRGKNYSSMKMYNASMKREPIHDQLYMEEHLPAET